MSEAKILLTKKVSNINLNTLTILTKVLILDDWVQDVPLQIDTLTFKDGRQKMESF